MKKIFLTFLALLTIFYPVSAKTDRISPEYLKSKKHFAIMNPFAENIVQKVIKKALKKEIGNGDYKVKFDGYTLSSMKKGVFKNLEIEGRDINIDNIPVPYLYLKSVTDYNRIDFNENPIKIKSDINFAYDLELTEKSINAAIKQKDYYKKLEKINKRAYPLFELKDVRIKMRHNKVHIIMDYILPLASSKKVKTFVISTNFKVDNGKICANSIGFDNSYGNLPLDKVTNLVNLLDPLSFTLAQLNENDCKGQVENVKIENNIIQISGKIFIVKR